MTHRISDDKPGFPWTPVLVLAAATMLMVTAEMLPTALLVPMSVGLGASEAQIGSLVAVWAGVVVVTSFPLSRWARRWPARPVIVVALASLVVSSGLTAVASDFVFVVAVRMLGAAAVGLLWATVNAYVADLVDDRMLGRAISLVLGGGTLGMVIGTPLARVLADATDWRVAFLVLAAALAVIAIIVAVSVPLVVRQPSAAAGGERSSRAAGRRLGIVTALIAVALIGHYGAYTFITRLAEPAASLLPGGVGGLLIVFGIASAVGVGIAARVETGTIRALLIALLTTAAAVAGTALAEPSGSLLVVVLWGVGSGAFPPLAQTLILRIAGPERRDFAGALIPVLFNGGIAVGASSAAVLAGGWGVESIPFPAAAAVLVSAAALAVTLVVLGGGASRERRSPRPDRSFAE
ncbi:MFS transporter [Microbacterium sp. LWH11-1.2]|uniref:MFS transporter n=1 Tax=Microbacterium sp. LWH11-1.2 TaxID=3135258 RepID=UPI0031389EE5